MDYPLSIPAILRRAGTLFGNHRVVGRRNDRAVARATYADVIDRVRRLAVALRALGVRPGDRVATLQWNSQAHLEAYLAVPAIGAVLHTLNLRLHADDLSYIVNDAADRVLIVDESLLPIYDKFRDRVQIEHVIVVSSGGVCERPAGPAETAYETLLAAADPQEYVEPDLDENHAAAMCYVRHRRRPKGVLYSHRAIIPLVRPGLVGRWA